MNYKVGQILFVILRKEAKVYPVQVVKEVTEKTLDGEVKSYMVRAGAKPEDVLGLDALDGEVFDSAVTARTTLIDRATSNISQRIDLAAQKAKEWYPAGFEQAVDDPLAAVRKAAAPKPPPKRKGAEVEALASELAQEAAAADTEASIVTLPDGTKARIGSIKLPDSMQ